MSTTYERARCKGCLIFTGGSDGYCQACSVERREGVSGPPAHSPGPCYVDDDGACPECSAAPPAPTYPEATIEAIARAIGAVDRTAYPWSSYDALARAAYDVVRGEMEEIENRYEGDAREMEAEVADLKRRLGEAETEREQWKQQVYDVDEALTGLVSLEDEVKALRALVAAASKDLDEILEGSPMDRDEVIRLRDALRWRGN